MTPLDFHQFEFLNKFYSTLNHKDLKSLMVECKPEIDDFHKIAYSFAMRSRASLENWYWYEVPKNKKITNKKRMLNHMTPRLAHIYAIASTLNLEKNVQTNWDVDLSGANYKKFPLGVWENIEKRKHVCLLKIKHNLLYTSANPFGILIAKKFDNIDPLMFNLSPNLFLLMAEDKEKLKALILNILKKPENFSSASNNLAFAYSNQIYCHENQIEFLDLDYTENRFHCK